MEKKGLIVQQGNRLKYIDSNGEEHLEYRKRWTGEMLDMVMEDFYQLPEEKDADEEDLPVAEQINNEEAQEETGT